MRRFRPRLRLVVAVVLGVAVLLPLAGIAGLRLYETELVRRTEAELEGQCALVAAFYQREVLAVLAESGRRVQDFGLAAPVPQPSGRRIQGQARPSLDRRTSPVLPPAPAESERPEGDDPAAVLAGARLSEQLHQAARTTLSALRVVGPGGVVVATSRTALGRGMEHWPEVQRGLRGEAVHLLRVRVTSTPTPPLESLSRGTPLRVFVGVPVVAEGRVLGVVVASRTPPDVAKVLAESVGSLAAAIALAVLLVLLLGTVLTLWVARPLKALRQQARRAAAGQRGAVQPLEAPGTEEVAELSEAIAQMARALEGRAAYLEAFAANVSHAFKTPLASIRGTVELLQDHLADMDADERRRFLGNLAADAARLDRLVKRLMVLARADVLDPQGSRCDVTALAREAVGRLDSVTLQADRPAEVAAAPEAVESLLANLLENARHHGGQRVEVRVVPADGGVRLEVADDGPGLDPAIAPRVFEPFVTGAQARGGTGLGLAIVRALAQAHGGRAEVAGPGLDGKGVCLRVWLPG